MGIGILLSISYAVVIAFIEYIRKGIAIKQGFSDNPEAVVNMSALWIILPYLFAWHWRGNEHNRAIRVINNDS